jgi:hypothetical protein
VFDLFPSDQFFIIFHLRPMDGLLLLLLQRPKGDDGVES